MVLWIDWELVVVIPRASLIICACLGPGMLMDRVRHLWYAAKDEWRSFLSFFSERKGIGFIVEHDTILKILGVLYCWMFHNFFIVPVNVYPEKKEGQTSAHIRRGLFLSHWVPYSFEKKISNRIIMIMLIFQILNLKKACRNRAYAVHYM